MTDLYVTAALEMVIRDSGEDGILLRLHSYPASVDNQGYWATPNLQYKVNQHDQAPRGSDAILHAFERFQATNAGDIREEIRRLAESFGLRGVRVEQVGSPLVESKPSINDPSVINAFSTMRFILTEVDEDSYANLVDPEGRHGFIVLPIPAAPSDHRIRMGKDSLGTDEECRFFLGKPLISGLNFLLDTGDALREMRRYAIDVTKVREHRTQFGLLAAADVSGYGEALLATLMGLLGDPEVERSNYRRRVLGTLEAALTAMGTTQVQSAGDGFMAGYPCTSGVDALTETLDRIIDSWTATLKTIAYEINPLLTQANSLPGLGTRMAIDAGVYEWGRINGMGSFFPAFDGGTVITAARLEQALRESMIDAQLKLEDGRTVAMSKQGHYLALSPEVAEAAQKLAGCLTEAGWTKLGSCVLESKKLVVENVLIYTWHPEVGASALHDDVRGEEPSHAEPYLESPTDLSGK